VPLGMGLLQQDIPTGLKYYDPANRLFLTYDYFPRFSVHRSFEALIGDLTAKGYKVEYSKVYHDEFFVLSVGSDRLDGYVRYHQLREGGLGFSLFWSHNAVEIHGERIATLMSGSLLSTMSGAPFVEPFTLQPKEDVAVARPIPVPPPAQPPPQPKPPETSGGTSGTGFFVTHDGLILTNAHVVKDCTQILLAPPQGAFVSAQVLARDTINDLALLKTETTSTHVAQLRLNIRLGENVEAFGYPLTTVLASSGNFTSGSVTALAGFRDDSRYLQISAPVQPGNSGGPLLDQSGNLVGVVSAKLNALNIMLATNGDIPQNVTSQSKRQSRRISCKPTMLSSRRGSPLSKFSLPT